MQIKRVVVGMDFSNPAVAGVQWAARQLAPDAEFLLVHVIDVPRMPEFLRGTAPRRDEIESVARQFASARLADLTTLLPGSHPPGIIRVGRPHEQLALLADEEKADLILIGPHGDRPRPWKLLGTTAERLVRAANRPVMVACAVPSTTPTHVLAAVDDDRATQMVLRWARGLADAHGAAVTAVHVISNAAMSDVLSLAAARARDEGDRLTRVLTEMVGEGTRWLETLLAEGLDTRRTGAVVSFGHAGDVILQTAVDIAADLIVLGRRGTSEVIPAILGSTVSTVLHGARCPVLVVTDDSPPREEQN
ncbi:MAG TPA: universal stress protein [Gemmatimonadaceae bacterium]|nr:universal stress protein [Gemmatimonadaceae bacterium]